MQIPKAITEEVILWESKYGGRRAFNQKFEFPDGQIRDFELVGANSSPVIIFAVTTDRNVITINQFRFAANRVIRELPGGNAKEGQTPKDVARAELLEETGYEACKILTLGTEMWFDPASWRASATFVLAIDCKKVAEQKLDATESIEIDVMPLSKWLGEIKDGCITDMKSIAITLMAMPYL